MDPKVLAGVINTSTARFDLSCLLISTSSRCWASEVNNPCPGVLENMPASRGYTGGFAAGYLPTTLGFTPSSSDV